MRGLTNEEREVLEDAALPLPSDEQMASEIRGFFNPKEQAIAECLADRGLIATVRKGAESFPVTTADGHRALKLDTLARGLT